MILPEQLESIYDRSSGRFDTRKMINRAAETTLPADFLDVLQSEGLTSEMLESYKLPLYRYQTQVTLHGIFRNLTKSGVGHYKNLILNQNGSLGVRYSAIDYAKKNQLGEWLAPQNWFYSRRSDSDYYVRSFNTRPEGVAVYNAINLDGFWATKQFLRNPLFERYYVVVYVSAVYQKDLQNLATEIAGVPFSKISADYTAAEVAEKKRQKERDERLDELKAEQAKEAEKAKQDFLAHTKPQLETLATWDERFREGAVLVTGVLTNDQRGFRLIYLTKKGPWYSAYASVGVDSLQAEPRTTKPPYDTDRVNEKSAELLAKALKRKYKLGLYDRSRKAGEEAPQVPVTVTSKVEGMNGTTVFHNTAKNGIEVKFRKMPSSQDLAWLKGQGYKWAKSTQLWYKTYSIWAFNAVRERFVPGLPSAQPEPPTTDPTTDTRVKVLLLLQRQRLRL